MRVLVNAVSAKRGGIVTYTENLIQALHARGVEPIFVVPPEIAEHHPRQTMAVRASDYNPVKRVLWEQLVWRRIVRRIRPDVLFSSANFGLFRCPVPQVLLMREGGLFDRRYLVDTAPSQGAAMAILRHFRRRMMVLSAREADRIIVPSQTMRRMLLEWAPDVAAKCAVNPYGTLGRLYRPAPEPRPWRADGILRLIFVSVYYPHKNPAVLCIAADQLRRSGLKTHVTITIDLDELRVPGAARDRLILERAERGGYVTLGHCAYHALPQLYQNHDVFVFPSVSETFGHPMAEALSTGLPIIAADTAINREICGDAALYFAPHSASALVDCLWRLDADAELRDHLRRIALENAKKLYDWDAHVDRLVACFEETAARRPLAA